MPTHFRTSHGLVTVTDCTRAGALTMGSTRDRICGLISISDAIPEKRPPREAMARIPTLRLTFDDVECESTMDFPSAGGIITTWDAPQKEHVERALTFARNHAHPSKRIVIHCFAGRSRSTAIGLAVIAQHLGPGHEAEAMTQLLTACERAPLPNMRIVAFADEILGRAGALVAVAQQQNDDPQPAEAERDKPVTGTALLAAVKRGDL